MRHRYKKRMFNVLYLLPVVRIKKYYLLFDSAAASVTLKYALSSVSKAVARTLDGCRIQLISSKTSTAS